MKAINKESVLIAGIEFSVGAKIVINGENDAQTGVSAEVTRVTTKSIFIRKDGETEDKMVVNRLVETYLEKKLWTVTPVLSEPKAPKVVKEKAPKIKKAQTLRKLSKNATIHYFTDCGLTKKEIKKLHPEYANSHISSAMFEVKNNVAWRKRSVDLYLAWNKIDPITYPLAPTPEPEATPEAVAQEPIEEQF